MIQLRLLLVVAVDGLTLIGKMPTIIYWIAMDLICSQQHRSSPKFDALISNVFQNQMFLLFCAIL